MSQPIQTVVGIDVGGKAKGFHAVALRNGVFEKTTSTNPNDIAAWCMDYKSAVVGVDAPCKWSETRSSRLAERELAKEGIRCFATPTRDCAVNHKNGFYDWVFNGEILYRKLAKHYLLFNGEQRAGPACIETFPHAIVCALAQRVVPAKPKLQTRRQALHRLGYDTSNLSNIDYVDAALCAVAAKEFFKQTYQHFGDSREGLIVIPT